MEFTCLLKKERNQYASLCVELDIASCGRTKKEAIIGLKTSIETYLEYMLDNGRKDEIYRPVSISELRDFIFSSSAVDEKLNRLSKNSKARRLCYHV